MLPAYVEYHRPASLEEAVEMFQNLKQANKEPMYWSGGTEILTLGRLNIEMPGSVIDIKNITETMVLEKTSQFLSVGAAVPLSVLEDDNSFPLLTEVSSGVADLTARNKITIGGNICGKIFYREAILPFLLADSHVLVADLQGMKEVPINELKMEEGQLLVSIQTDASFLHLPFIARKIRKQWETGYPLITAAAVKTEGQIRLAFSGLCPFPFRSSAMENELNKSELPIENRIERALEHVPEPILDDIEGSREYRLFVLRNLLLDFLTELEGV